MEFLIYLFPLGTGIGAAWLAFRAAQARRFWIILTLVAIGSAGIAAAIWLPANDGSATGIGYALVGLFVAVPMGIGGVIGGLVGILTRAGRR